MRGVCEVAEVLCFPILMELEFEGTGTNLLHTIDLYDLLLKLSPLELAWVSCVDLVWKIIPTNGIIVQPSVNNITKINTDNNNSDTKV